MYMYVRIVMMWFEVHESSINSCLHTMRTYEMVNDEMIQRLVISVMSIANTQYAYMSVCVCVVAMSICKCENINFPRCVPSPATKLVHFKSQRKQQQTKFYMVIHPKPFNIERAACPWIQLSILRMIFIVLLYLWETWNPLKSIDPFLLIKSSAIIITV